MKKTIIGLVTLIVVNSIAFSLSPTELINLRTEWDTNLRKAAEKIAANPPEFELHFFNEVKPKDLTEEDYKNETMTLDVLIPYMKQISGFENRELANSLLSELHKIEESKNWGYKINNFPWSYAEDIGNDNWLLKANANHVDRFNFIITLLDKNKKIIAQKPITYMVCYSQQYSGFVMISDNSHFNAWLAYYGAYYDNPCEDDYMPFQISLKESDIDVVSVKVENRGKQTLSILPAEENAVRKIPENSKGFYKVVGNHGLGAIRFDIPSYELHHNLDNYSNHANLYLDFTSSYSYEDYLGYMGFGFNTGDMGTPYAPSYFVYNGEQNWENGWLSSSSRPGEKRGLFFILAGSPKSLEDKFYAYYLDTAIDVEKRPKEEIISEIKDSMVPLKKLGISVLKTEVTQEMYSAIMGKNPSYFHGAKLPVECISYIDAIEFCNELSRQSGLTPCYGAQKIEYINLKTNKPALWSDYENEVAMYTIKKSRDKNFKYEPQYGKRVFYEINEKANGYRLPTYNDYNNFINDLIKTYPSESADTICWYAVNSSDKTHNVGQKLPSGYGLYDLLGNVYEITEDLSGCNPNVVGLSFSDNNSLDYLTVLMNDAMDKYKNVGIRLVRRNIK